MCGRRASLTVYRRDHDAWTAGALIQRAFPTLAADQREMLLTGTHPRCWDTLFPEEG